MMRSASSLSGAVFRVLGLAGSAGGLALACAVPAQAKSDVAPYIEVEQVLNAELDGGGDTFTYTSVAAGVDALVTTRRVQAQVSYRYERRIDWSDRLANEDVHSGLAQVRLEVAPEVLSLEGGAIAARGRLDSRGPAFGFDSADDRNIADVYGAYVGPSLSTHVGSVAINANYHFGYVKVDDHAQGDAGYPGGPLDRYDSSTSHSANLSVGMAPGELPFGWTVAAGYDREQTNRLKQRFVGQFIRGDVVVPLGPNVAVAGGVGYEKLRASQQDFLRDSAGVPVITPGGNLVADPTKPRLLAYDQDGLIWDAGVIWRPSPRLELQARVGRRYGGTTVTGSLQYQMGHNVAFSAVVYDSVSSFGRLIISDLNGLPKEFKVNNHGLNTGISGVGGCVFGSDPGSGRCFDDALQSVSTSNFRNQGLGVLLSGGHGVWDMELGFGYGRRKYLTPEGAEFALHGVVEEYATIEAAIGRRLTRTSGIDFDAYASWFDSGIAGNDNVFSTGATATYYRSFLLERLQGQASIGIYRTDSNGSDSSTIGSAMLGLRYQF